MHAPFSTRLPNSQRKTHGFNKHPQPNQQPLGNTVVNQLSLSFNNTIEK